jgi:hypothetical protein
MVFSHVREYSQPICEDSKTILESAALDAISVQLPYDRQRIAVLYYPHVYLDLRITEGYPISQRTYLCPSFIEGYGYLVPVLHD